MLEELAEAIKEQDYQTAEQLLEELKQQEPDNPWIPFYVARLDEAKGNLTAASQSYRQLLQNTTHRKIISQARQGIERLAKIQPAEPPAEPSKVTTRSPRTPMIRNDDTQETGLGVLVLEPIASELKQAAAQKFAEIMQIDPYSARLQLPSRAWRLYRVGAIADLRPYAKALQEAEIPCFCTSIADITPITVYSVKYWETVNPQGILVYQPQKGQSETATFTLNWSEVGQRVEGALPIFEECVEVGLRGKIERKTKILDYVKVCDLHLPKQKVIIRLCDQLYQFHQGISFSAQQKSSDGQTTIRDNWSHLMQFIGQQLSDIPLLSEFTPFAQTTLDFQETLLKVIDPHIDLLRREETSWDAAFHLYSSLALLNL